MKNKIFDDFNQIYNKYTILTPTLYRQYGKYSLKDINKYFGSFINAIKEYNQLYSINIQLKEKDNRLIKKRVCSNETREKISTARKQYWDNKYKKTITYDELKEIIWDCYRTYGQVNMRTVCTKYGIEKNAILQIINNLPNITTYKQLLCSIGIPLYITIDKKISATIDSKQDVLDEVNAYIEKYNNFIFSDFLKTSKYSKYSIKKILKLNATNILNLLDNNLKQQIIKENLRIANNDRRHSRFKENMKTKEEYIQIIKECYNNCSAKFTQVYLLANTDLTVGYIKHYFGSFNKMLEELNLPINMKKNITKDNVLTHMKALYDKYGKLNSTIQRKDSTIAQSTIKHLFGNFNDMLKEFNTKYNLNLNDKVFKPTDKELLYEAKQLIDQYGTLSTNILKQYSKYAYQTYLNHFGNMQTLYNKLNIINNNVLESTAYVIINRIAKILLNDNYIIHHKFDWLVNPKTNYKLHLDAYFPDFNLAVEFDGKQHFEEVKYFSNNLEEIQFRDKVKNRLCKEHGIKLLRIAYNDDLSTQALKSALIIF